MLGSRRPSVFRNEHFRVLLLGQGIAWTGSAATTMALVFALLDSRWGMAGAGLVLALRAVPSVVFGLIGGVAADRFRKKYVVLGSSFVVGLVQIALALVLWAADVSLWLVIVAVVVVGSTQALSASSMFSLLPELVEAEMLQQGQAVLRLVRNSATVVGPVLGGLAVYAAGSHVVILVDGCAALLACVLFARLPVTGQGGSREPIWSDLRAGWGELISRPWLMAAIPAFSLALLCWAGGFGILAPAMLVEAGGDARSWGLIGAALSAGYVAGSLVALRFEPQNRVRASLLCQAMTFVPIALMAASAPLAVWVLGAFVAGFFMDLAGVLWGAGLQMAVPPEVLGRVSSYDYVGTFGLVPLGYVIAPYLSQGLGIRGALAVCALGILVAPLVAATSWRTGTSSLRDSRAPVEAR